MSPVLSLVVPCYNEKDNIPLFVDAIKNCSFLPEWEIIFVDDNSPDDTITAVRTLAQTDHRIRGIRRIDRRGLSSAVIEGVMSSSAPFIAVMDGDLQHDETCLAPMLKALSSGKYDLVVASRHIDGGANHGLANIWRRFVSHTGGWVSRTILRTSLTDPMSGFFAVRRECFDQRAEHMSGTGFKILLDLILAGRTPLRTTEVPMIFRDRLHGDSKLSWKVMLSFVRMVAHHKTKRRRS